MRSRQPLAISARFMIAVLAAGSGLMDPTGLYVALHTSDPGAERYGQPQCRHGPLRAGQTYTTSSSLRCPASSSWRNRILMRKASKRYMRGVYR
jgi:hypothetical protein